MCVVCVCVCARVVPYVGDRFGAHVRAVLGVRRRSLAGSSRLCQAAYGGVLFVAHGGRADDRGRAARDRS